MSDTFSLSTTPLSVASSPSSHATISNAGAGTVYYKTESDVSDRDNDGSLAVGASVTFRDGPRWFVTTAIGARVFVNYVPEATTDLATQAELDAAVLSTDAVSDKLDNLAIFNVKDYGAKGDGRTDDTAAIQAAFDAAADSRGRAYLPTGVCMVSGLHYSNGLVIQGEGPTNTILKKLAGASNSILGGSLVSGPGITGDPITDLTVHGIGFDGNLAAAPSGPALLHAYASTRLRVSSCDFYDGASYGMGLQGLPFEADPLKQGPHIDTLIVDSKFYGNAAGGLDVKSSEVLTLLRCSAEENDDIGIDVRGQSIVLESCYSTRNAEAGFAVRAHADGQLLISADINNCFSWANGSGMQLGSSGSSGRSREFHFNVVGGHFFDNTNAFGGGIVIPSISNPADTKIHLTVLGGHFYGNAGEGLDLFFGDSLVIDGVTVRDNDGRGINLEDIDGALIADVIVRDNGGTGIRWAGTSSNIKVLGGIARGNVPNLSGSGTAVKVTDLETDTSSSVASSSTITLPHAHNLITITGTTNITSVAASWPGRIVVLKFNNALTVTDGSNLSLNGDFVTAADATLVLVCDGTNWWEVARTGAFASLEIDGDLNHDGTRAGFYGTAPVTKPTALTRADASTIDGTYGAEEQAVLGNVRTRVGELESKLQSLGLLA